MSENIKPGWSDERIIAHIIVTQFLLVKLIKDMGSEAKAYDWLEEIKTGYGLQIPGGYRFPVFEEYVKNDVEYIADSLRKMIESNGSSA